MDKAIDNGVMVEYQDGQVYFVFAEKYQSQIGEECRRRKLDCLYVAVVSMKDGSVSLRSVKPGFDVSAVAKNYGGGGHAAAAGYRLDAAMLLRRFIVG